MSAVMGREVGNRRVVVVLGAAREGGLLDRRAGPQGEGCAVGDGQNPDPEHVKLLIDDGESVATSGLDHVAHDLVDRLQPFRE